MQTDFEKRVRSIPWSSYPHPCGQDQAAIPGLLLAMVQASDELKVQAAENLWDMAAHQGNVGPSSVPTSQFLIELLADQPAVVQGENLDTLYQFSNYFSGEPWSAELRNVFVAALPLFKRLSISENEDVSDFAKMIIENIETNV